MKTTAKVAILNPQGRTAIRNLLGASNSVKILLVKNSNEKPSLHGSYGHYENKSGDVVMHPNAYRRAWGKPIYICSSVYVKVGETFKITYEPKKKVHYANCHPNSEVIKNLLNDKQMIETDIKSHVTCKICKRKLRELKKH